MSLPIVSNETVVEMAQAGVLHGHRKSKTHPKMRPYIALTRNEIEFFKPEAVIYGLDKATEFVKGIVAKKGTILVAGTNATAHESVRRFAEAFGFPFITERWLGGTLTNFKVIRARMNYYRDLKEKKMRGELAKYTKKEQLEFDKELAKLGRKFDGLATLERVPDAIFVVDAALHEGGVREARRMKVPVVAVIDNNDNPQPVDYPIVANDHSKSSIEWVLKKISEGVRQASVPEAPQPTA